MTKQQNHVYRRWLVFSFVLCVLSFTHDALGQNVSIQQMLKVKNASLSQLDSIRQSIKPGLPALQIDSLEAEKRKLQMDSLTKILPDSLLALSPDSLRKVVGDSLARRYAEYIDQWSDSLQQVVDSIKKDPSMSPLNILEKRVEEMPIDTTAVQNKAIEVVDTATQIIESKEVNGVVNALDEQSKNAINQATDSLQKTLPSDSLNVTKPLPIEDATAAIDSVAPVSIPMKRWIPDSRKATWYALVIPGGGQIYNRKYWKLPIVYGGFVGCAYALTWNSRMYKDYRNAYLDFMDGNPATNSFQELLPANYSYSDSQLEDILKNRKDMYRRYRDMSIFAFIGVYILSVVDAYVDAELSDFDLTPDLSLEVAPANFNDETHAQPWNNNSNVGVSCRLNF